ncbi:hypothetical protein ZIOFF_033442 [Zingiber officinale]|uniref:Poly(A) RNA polymerase mitochondrial-like central palm domain-containing protein n=1 Tax=Zingiber officinale TaxID=94328 RepID=A0A8J5GQC7_ZINOF|nr:hypothetical protein ZIOFF_033442 [Zingiber officinale]
MHAWKKDLNIRDEVLLLSNGNREFTLALGMKLDLSDKPMGLGVRSHRYTLLAEDGVVKVLNLEDGGLASSIEYIPNARVPLLKYISRQHNISFDVSVNNHLGVMKSNVLKWLSEIDDRFRDMVLVLKEWAKAQDINDPKSGSLSSYALCLLVIFHFQTCEPPIFPPLRAIINEERISDRGWSNLSRSPFEDVCSINIQRFRSSRIINQSSLAQLLLSFFDKLVDDLSTLYIEDPFERMENAARTVCWVELPKISNAFQNSHNKLSSEIERIEEILAMPNGKTLDGETRPIGA